MQSSSAGHPAVGYDGDWFRNKTALVTGAASGMGREIALALGKAGAQIGINYRSNEHAARSLQSEIEVGGGAAIVIGADVSRPADVQRMFERMNEAYGKRLDVLVNNAGQWMDKLPITDCTLDQWGQMLRVNVTSVFLCCQEAARIMGKQGNGVIVNIGSLAGHTGGGGGTIPYAAAKAAVHTFTRGLAKELAPHGVRVNAVAPGMVDTPMLEGRVSAESAEQLRAATPLGRFAQSDEIVGTVLFLLSPAASYITGQIIDVNGGLLMR